MAKGLIVCVMLSLLFTITALEVDEIKLKRAPKRNSKKGFQKGNQLWKKGILVRQGKLESGVEVPLEEDAVVVEDTLPEVKEVVQPTAPPPPAFPGSLPQHGFTYALPPPYLYPGMTVLPSEPEVPVDM